MLDTRTSLIERVCDPHDADGWAEFVRLYEPLLAAYVRKRGFNEHDAGDAVQEVLTVLWQKIGRYDRSKGRFRTWLWRVTYNAATDLGRKRRRQNDAEWEYRQDAPVAEVPEPDEEWTQDYRRRIVRHALEKAREGESEKAWACFEGRILRKRPAAEIGRELGLSNGAVYTNASRVLKKVRALCAAWEEDLASA